MFAEEPWHWSKKDLLFEREMLNGLVILQAHRTTDGRWVAIIHGNPRGSCYVGSHVTSGQAMAAADRSLANILKGESP